MFFYFTVLLCNFNIRPKPSGACPEGFGRYSRGLREKLKCNIVLIKCLFCAVLSDCSLKIFDLQKIILYYNVLCLHLSVD